MNTIPMIIEQNQSLDQSNDLLSLLLKQRIIFCIGEIDEELSASICAQLLYLSYQSDEPIHLYIQSYGGSVSAGLAIYDTIQFIKNEVSTIGIGLCASMAALLLSCGSPNKRFALKNTEIMIHQPIASLQGKSSEIMINAQFVAHQKEKINQLLSFHTHQSIEKINQDTLLDTYFSAEEALNYGFIDQIL